VDSNNKELDNWLQ